MLPNRLLVWENISQLFEILFVENENRIWNNEQKSKLDYAEAWNDGGEQQSYR